MSSDPTSQDVSNKLIQWLTEEQDRWKFSKINDPSLFLNLQVKSINDRNIHVTIDNTHDRIFVLAKMGTNEKQGKAFALLPQDEKKRFNTNLVISLFHLGIGVGHPNLAEKPENITLQKLIYFDGLTKHTFFDSLTAVFMGIETIQILFALLPGVPDDNDSLK